MSSRNFSECTKNGGKVVTKKTKNGKIIKICYDKIGKSHAKVIKRPEKEEGIKSMNTNQQAQRQPIQTQPQVVQEVASNNIPKATQEDLLKLKEYFDKMYRK